MVLPANNPAAHRPNFSCRGDRENEAFWSITVDGNNGSIKSDHYIVNPSSVKLNSDGTFTVHFGSKDALGDVPNRLDVNVI